MIQILSYFPKDVLHEVSPKIASKIKPQVKLPMVLMMGVCGIMAGVCTIFFKFVGEMVESGEFSVAPLLTISLTVFGFVASWVLFYTLNWAMRYYDQLDVIPTYFAQILIWTLLSGLIIMDEASEYSAASLVGIFIAALACFVGI